ncbi:hypothetical protein [Bacillus sp. PS06]|uniref:hypothetical protein n=1 Tax=Bacillus sp. PS06 TaxID=2764176 RepID=UPI00177F3CB2|nr:hypothetical protein [Bacillus sp. PS06]MBD8069808.1 hypothetical protein [Bacillus sp. PS06]
MERRKWLNYVSKLLWVIGLTILAIVSFNIEEQLRLSAQETFNHVLVLWSKPLVSTIFGIYISLLFIKKWSYNINSSLFWCVALPCMLLSFIYPILVTAFYSNPDFFIDSLINLWIYKISSYNVFGIVTGFTLMLSLFAQPKKTVQDVN